MFGKMKNDIVKTLDELKANGMYKQERVITSPQGDRISVYSSEAKTASEGTGERATDRAAERTVINFCANNYLGLSDNPAVIRAAKETMDKWGYGLSSVRFICGTQQIHKELEAAVSRFLHTEDTLLYAACFDANGGVFEPLLGPEDAIISDELNHASIIDGVRLCKAGRYRYKHSDMGDLQRCLEETVSARYRLICTDGVFSMDGDIARLADICELAEKHDALVLVDDSHATGYIGETGRGTPEHWGVEDRIDLITTTFGKALGGASGGCASGRRELIELLRQRSRPYLFSNTLAPAVVGGTLKALELIEQSGELRKRLLENTDYFKGGMKKAGFDIVPGDTAIVPVMLYEEKPAVAMAEELLRLGIYVIGFTYPVVPKGKARIRVQLSAAHTKEQLKQAVEAFTEVGKALGVIIP
jgi:glycine C-acetyltransferase